MIFPPGTISSFTTQAVDEELIQLLDEKGYDPQYVLEKDAEVDFSHDEPIINGLPNFNENETQTWIDSARELYGRFAPKPAPMRSRRGGKMVFTEKPDPDASNLSDEEVAQWGLELMGSYNYRPEEWLTYFDNVEDMSQREKVAFYNLLSNYEKLPDFTWSGTSRMLRKTLTSPSTYVGLGTLGAGFLARQAFKQAGKKGILAYMKKLMPAAIATGLETGAYTGLDDAMRQISAMEAGAQEEFDLLRTGAAAGVGTVAGTGLGLAIPGAADAVGKALGAGVRMAGGGKTIGMGVGPVPQTPMPVEQQSRMVSARFPTAAKRQEDPVASQLNIGFDAVAADPKVLQRNTDILRIYPGVRSDASADPTEFAGQFINDAKENLIWLHNRVPEQTRQRSKLWYDGANKLSKEFSQRFDVPDTSVAGVMAALSPQKDWFMNVSLAERTLDVLTNQRSFSFSDDMAQRMDNIFPGEKYAALREAMSGKTLNDLEDPTLKAFFIRIYDETYNDRSHRIITPEGDFGDVVLTDKGVPSGTGWGSLVEISKAVRAYESGGDRALMTDILGSKHKVRSFYNNIIEPNSPNGDVTIDTHAVAAALLRPLSGASREVHHNFGSSPMKSKQPEGWQGSANSSLTGVQGTYGLYAEAYRQAAQELGILPRELQSITWEAVRGMFTDRFKTAKNVQGIDDLWRNYSNGNLSIDEVRQAVEQAAGGINAPTWE